MEKRRLGRTGHDSTVITFGAAAIGQSHMDQAAADRVIELVLSHGVNHIDVAPTYGTAMEQLAPWMPDIRDRVFLASKTTERTRAGARENIEDCLSRLEVESFDLFQLHAVASMEDLDAVTAPGGALEALVEMRDRGLTRWIGITGHGPKAPLVHLEALRRFDFDTIMFPYGASLFRNEEYRRDAAALREAANARDVGIQTIKTMARGGWGERKREFHTWYEPHSEQADVDRALWWALSQPIHTAPSPGEAALLGKVLTAAERFVPLSEAKQAEAVLAQRPLFPQLTLGIPASA